MFIVMHCGGMPFNAHTLEQKSLGGSETAAYSLARELAAKGHRVTLFTNHPEEMEADGVAYRYAGALSESTPLGDRYQIYAVATPHDVNITQRNPAAFLLPVAAKVRAWWLHDVPHEAHGAAVRAGLLGTDLIFTVSEWHRQQVIETWSVKPEAVVSIENGVDLSLFEGPHGSWVMPQEAQRFKLLYTSRPERGLETLVQPGGVMERLAAAGSRAHLYVCSYDNKTAPMANYYGWLDARCDELPNVTRLGSLTKSELADVMRQCDLLAYPTTFNETSCITAMEAMAAGLPMLSSACGALLETCEDSGAVLLPLVDAARPRPGAMEAGDPSKEVDVDVFAQWVLDFENATPEELDKVRVTQREAAKRHTWELVADRAEAAVRSVFAAASVPSKLREMMRNSDYYAMRAAIDLEGTIEGPVDLITASTLAEMAECYGFTTAPSWDEHYARYYDYEKDRGVDYGPENLENNPRFEYVSGLVGSLPGGSHVLDYGCAHGHYTINLARRFPELEFVGVDITPSNVEKARAWAEAEGVTNVSFVVGRVEEGAILGPDCLCPSLGVDPFDMVIAAEVIEHVADAQHHIDVLNDLLVDGGRMVVTVPYGPWEALGYEQHWPWRAHVHHFERADLHEMCGHFPGFAVTVISSGRSPQGDPLGSYVAMWDKPEHLARSIDYARKWAETAPRQTVSVCMIVKDGAETIGRALRSTAAVADEFVIAIDEGTSDETLSTIHKVLNQCAPHKPRNLFTASSPLEVGFAAARNRTVEAASGDWILWLDADEVLDGVEHLAPYLRNNAYDGYALPHHHFSIEPAGVLKTDYPIRLFRNHKGVAFSGLVHEHPEIAENQSIPHSAVLDSVVVAHYGYTNEETRRRRFNRNYPLMVRDRQENPNRHLGKFLWLRDLFQVCRYELEAGSLVTDTMVDRALEGVALWEELLRDAPLRLAVDALEWYSGLVEILGGGVPFEIAIKRRQDLRAAGVFRDDIHANKLAARMMREG